MTTLDKLESTKSALDVETDSSVEIAHHKQQIQIYVARTFQKRLMEAEAAVEESGDPDTMIKMLDFQRKLAGWDNAKQDDKETRFINIEINLGDEGTNAVITTTVEPIKDEVIDVPAKVVAATPAPAASEPEPEDMELGIQPLPDIPGLEGVL